MDLFSVVIGMAIVLVPLIGLIIYSCLHVSSLCQGMDTLISDVELDQIADEALREVLAEMAAEKDAEKRR